MYWVILPRIEPNPPSSFLFSSVRVLVDEFTFSRVPSALLRSYVYESTAPLTSFIFTATLSIERPILSFLSVNLTLETLAPSICSTYFFTVDISFSWIAVLNSALSILFSALSNLFASLNMLSVASFTEFWSLFISPVAPSSMLSIASSNFLTSSAEPPSLSNSTTACLVASLASLNFCFRLKSSV